jgi:hypothetical protein
MGKSVICFLLDQLNKSFQLFFGEDVSVGEHWRVDAPRLDAAASFKRLRW